MQVSMCTRMNPAPAHVIRHAGTLRIVVSTCSHIHSVEGIVELVNQFAVYL